MNILVTGVAGFIGFHTAKALLERGDSVVGIDNMNEYYDVSLKKSRLDILKKYDNFSFHKIDLAKFDLDIKVDSICHLGAQAGVRYSIENPIAYENSNVLGTLRIFEFARHKKIKNVVYASSSSVYGNCPNVPFKESEKLDEPISLYAATKKANELYAHVYHNLYGINMIGLRFFTVYGPYGRPDMAIFKFTKNIIEGKPIDVYNNGKLQRDFTYVDDIVSGVVSALDSGLSFEIINLARGETIELLDFIKAIEDAVGKKAKLNMMSMQAGDVFKTYGDISLASQKLGYKPKVSVKEGVKKFVDWYKGYYK